MNRHKRREKRRKERDRDKGMDMIMDMDGIQSGSRRLIGGVFCSNVFGSRGHARQFKVSKGESPSIIFLNSTVEVCDFINRKIDNGGNFMN